jgi:tetratricopeptide (TPR) repeat protein
MQFRTAINRSPDDLKAHRDLGYILAASGKYEEASRELETAISLPGARAQYAMIKYAKGDRNSARENAIRARDEGDTSNDLLILLTRVALENSDIKDARKWLKLGLADSTATAVFVSLAKEAAFKAYYKRDPVEAEETLRMIPLPSEPEVYMLRGRVAMMRAASSRFDKASVAESVNNFQLAASASKQSKNSRYPELKTVELELAEAYFISGDFVRARETAQSFLNNKSKPDNAPAPENVNMESIRSYEPVAMLISTAAEFVLKRSGPNPIKSLTSLLGNYSDWPTLYLPVPLPNGKTSKIQVAEWSFDTFDEFVCSGLSVSKKEVVEGLSALVQNKLATDQERKKRAC